MRPGVSLGILVCPGVSWGILGCPGVIRPTHLKMALKTILILLGKSSTSDKGFCSLEIDTTTSELSTYPPKKKFPHVYQDEKCNEKWPFLKNRTMACLAVKQNKCNA